MLVKICGVTTEEAAQAAAEAGADFIGFVFAPSRRKITAEKAKKISHALPPTVHTVGVFVNETVEKMLSIAAEVNLDYIQLHGSEPPALAEQLPYKVIKAFSVDEHITNNITNYPCDYLLLDSAQAGSGKTFNWRAIQNVSINKNKLLLAGGLSLDNIKQAKQVVNPAGADVSTGVETDGKKDIEKIKKFIEFCKETKGEDDRNEKLYNA